MGTVDKDWPLTKEQKCQWCDTVLVLARKDGRNHRGQMSYYYTSSPHTCPEKERIGKALKAQQKKMERVIFGGKK